MRKGMVWLSYEAAINAGKTGTPTEAPMVSSGRQSGSNGGWTRQYSGQAWDAGSGADRLAPMGHSGGGCTDSPI